MPTTATPADDRIASELAAHGLRATRQRIGVLRQLRRMQSHPSALELHRRLVREQPQLSRKTVYEVLDSLVRVGLAACVTHGGDPFRYEARSEPHYHARCRVCGRLFDVPAGADGPIRGAATLPEGFEVEHVSVTLEGLCRRCRDAI